MQQISLPLTDDPYSYLQLIEALEALKQGEIIEIRLNYFYTPEEVELALNLIEETVGQPLKRQDNHGGFHKSYLIWADDPSKETL